MSESSNSSGGTERDEPETKYHAEGSRVVHHDRDCHHLDNANEVEDLDEEEAEKYRTCRQCWYNGLSFEEKLQRKRESRRARRTQTVTVRYRR